LGFSSFLSAFSCSGTTLNEVGELNAAGHGGSNAAGADSSAAGTIATAGKAGSEAPSGDAGSGTGSVVGDVAGDGGTAGMPGGGDTAGMPGGGEAGQGPYGCANCTTVASGQDVRGADINDQSVYWTDYGSKDKLGNYQDDGRLYMRGLDGGPTTVVADSLLGPGLVGVSSDYVYLTLDQRAETDLPDGVARMPLSGGPLEPLQSLGDGFSPAMFVATADYEYWNSIFDVYRIAQTAGAQVETFFHGEVGPILADDTRLYFYSKPSPLNAFGGAEGVWTLPLTGGGTPKKLTDYAGGLLQLQGDYLYGVEHVEFGPTYLTRMPKAGGAWKRVANAHDGTRWASIAVDGDNYLVDEQADTLRWIFRGTLVGPDTTLDFEAAPVVRSTAWSGWAVSRVGIFFANADGLLVTPTTAP
jgi:hypothetical protein